MGAVTSVVGAPTRATIPLNKLAPEAALRRLELTIVRRLEGFLHGDHLGLLPGPGSDISDARIYVPGEDDVRRIDWAVTARTTVPYVRDTISDRELEVWALLDVTPSMNWGTEGVTKRDLGIAAIATLYTVFLLFGAGIKFLLLSFIIYVPGTILFFMARREQEKRVFSPPELILFVISILGAIVGIIGLVSGRISI